MPDGVLYTSSKDGALIVSEDGEIRVAEGSTARHNNALWFMRAMALEAGSIEGALDQIGALVASSGVDVDALVEKHKPEDQAVL